MASILRTALVSRPERNDFAMESQQFLNLQKKFKDLEILANALQSKGVVTRAIATESEYLLPNSGIMSRFGDSQSSIANYKLALEEVSVGVWAIVIAGIAILVTIIAKIINWITGGSSSGSSRGGGGSSSSPRYTYTYTTYRTKADENIFSDLRGSNPKSPMESILEEAQRKQTEAQKRYDEAIKNSAETRKKTDNANDEAVSAAINALKEKLNALRRMEDLKKHTNAFSDISKDLCSGGNYSFAMIALANGVKSINPMKVCTEYFEEANKSFFKLTEDAYDYNKTSDVGELTTIIDTEFKEKSENYYNASISSYIKKITEVVVLLDESKEAENKLVSKASSLHSTNTLKDQLRILGEFQKTYPIVELSKQNEELFNSFNDIKSSLESLVKQLNDNKEKADTAAKFTIAKVINKGIHEAHANVIGVAKTYRTLDIYDYTYYKTLEDFLVIFKCTLLCEIDLNPSRKEKATIDIDAIDKYLKEVKVILNQHNRTGGN